MAVPVFNTRECGFTLAVFSPHTLNADIHAIETILVEEDDTIVIHWASKAWAG